MKACFKGLVTAYSHHCRQGRHSSVAMKELFSCIRSDYQRYTGKMGG